MIEDLSDSILIIYTKINFPSTLALRRFSLPRIKKLSLRASHNY